MSGRAKAASLLDAMSSRTLRRLLLPPVPAAPVPLARAADRALDVQYDLWADLSAFGHTHHKLSARVARRLNSVDRAPLFPRHLYVREGGICKRAELAYHVANSAMTNNNSATSPP